MVSWGTHHPVPLSNKFSPLGELLRLLTIKIAYRVDFNLTLTSFEPNIKTIRQLIDLSLSSPRPSPARILFISSIGVLRSTYISLFPNPSYSHILNTCYMYIQRL